MGLRRENNKVSAKTISILMIRINREVMHDKIHEKEIAIETNKGIGKMNIEILLCLYLNEVLIAGGIKLKQKSLPLTLAKIFELNRDQIE